MIDGHGDDLHRYAGRISINFSSNIFSGFDHTDLLRHLFADRRLFDSYPEPDAHSASAAIARMEGIDAGSVYTGNGATEIIYNIAAANAGAVSYIAAPTFREYQDACRMMRHDIRFFPADAERIPDFEAHSCIWLCNPNNPTGRAYPLDMLTVLIESRSDCLFIIDQAYKDYCMKPVLPAQKAVEAENVILLSSLTKRFAVPGLRIGYAVAAPRLIGCLEALRQPWSVNAAAQLAVPHLIDRRDEYTIDRRMLHAEALRISEVFRATGIDVDPTDCNFLLARLPFHKAPLLKDHLALEKGLLIRDASNFETLDSRCFRVAAQRGQENDTLITAVEEWISSMR